MMKVKVFHCRMWSAKVYSIWLALSSENYSFMISVVVCFKLVRLKKMNHKLLLMRVIEVVCGKSTLTCSRYLYTVKRFIRSATANFTTKIDCPTLVNKILKDSFILAHFKIICGNADQVVEKEVAKNLLEHIGTLFIRVRSFSYAKC